MGVLAPPPPHQHQQKIFSRPLSLYIKWNYAENSGYDQFQILQMLTQNDMGKGGVKNNQKVADVINEQPLTRLQAKKKRIQRI